jgi:hypothetical protein
MTYPSEIWVTGGPLGTEELASSVLVGAGALEASAAEEDATAVEVAAALDAGAEMVTPAAPQKDWAYSRVAWMSAAEQTPWMQS